MPNGMDEYRIAAFDQNKLLGKYYPNRRGDAEVFADRRATEGICYALSVNWISRHMRFKGEAPSARIESLSSEKSIVEAMQNQLFASSSAISVGIITNELHSMKSTDSDFDRNMDELKSIAGRLRAKGNANANENFERAIKLYGLESYNSLVSDMAVDRNNFDACVTSTLNATSSTHTYHLIQIQGQKGGHAVSCYKSGGSLFTSAHLYFFDPNYGEFKVPSSKVKAFINAFLSVGVVAASGTVKTIDIARIS